MHAWIASNVSFTCAYAHAIRERRRNRNDRDWLADHYSFAEWARRAVQCAMIVFRCDNDNAVAGAYGLSKIAHALARSRSGGQPELEEEHPAPFSWINKRRVTGREQWPKVDNNGGHRIFNTHDQ
jgi:hypothetical protein